MLFSTYEYKVKIYWKANLSVDKSFALVHFYSEKIALIDKDDIPKLLRSHKSVKKKQG